MTRPICKNCIRVGSECTYPLRQKRRSKVTKSSPPTRTNCLKYGVTTKVLADDGKSTMDSLADGDFAKFDSMLSLGKSCLLCPDKNFQVNRHWKVS